MVEFLVRLVIVVLVVWLVQTILATFTLKEPAPKVIFVVVLIFGVLWLILGGALTPMGSFK